MNDRNWGFRTRALHAGGRPDPTTGSRAVPIYQSTSFVFEDTADAADKFALQNAAREKGISLSDLLDELIKDKLNDLKKKTKKLRK